MQSIHVGLFYNEQIRRALSQPWSMSLSPFLPLSFPPPLPSLTLPLLSISPSLETVALKCLLPTSKSLSCILVQPTVGSISAKCHAASRS